VDAGAAISESNEGNNNHYHAINVLNRPDLLVDITTVPYTGSVSNQGDTFTVRYRVRNQRNVGFTTNFNVTFYYCTSNTTASCTTTLGSQAISTNFGPNGTAYFNSSTLKLPASATPGTRYIRFFVDSGAAVAETDETNNNTFATITVLNRPDLTVNNTVAPLTGTTEVGKTFTVRGRVNNISAVGFSTDFYVYYYYCPAKNTSGCTLLGSNLITNNMAGNSFVDVTSSNLTLPLSAQAGTRYIRYFVDAPGAISESNENNNNTYDPITVVVKPDLTADSTSAPYTGATEVGRTFTVRARIRNLTTVAFTQNFYVRYYYCPSNNTTGCVSLGTSYVTTDFAANAAHYVNSPNLTLPLSAQAGTRYIRWYVDSGSNIIETNENNNNVYDPITVVVKPDLVVDNTNAPATGSTATAGDTFTVTGRVRNLTTASFSTDFYVYYYYCPASNTTGCTYLNRTHVTTNLTGNGTVNVTSPTLTLPSTAAAGTRYIRYFVDGTTVVAEANENNNNTYDPILVVNKPDLTADTSTVPHSGSIANAGNTFTARVRVRNLTSITMNTDFTLQYFYCPNRNTTGCISLGSRTITTNFNGKASYYYTSSTLTLPTSAAQGTRYIRFFVDSGNVVNEGNEGNNNHYHQIQILNRPDLTADTTAAPIAGSVANVGDTFTVRARVRNLTNTGFSTDFYVYYYYCPSSTTSGCTKLGQTLVTTNFGNGTNLTVTSPTLTMPGAAAPGTRYIRWFVDATGVVAETDETNNNVFKAINVLNRPDLTADTLVAPASGSTNVGTNFTVRARIVNKSSVGFPTDFNVSYYYCTAASTSTCTYLNRTTVTSNFVGNGTLTVTSPTLTLPTSAIAGTGYIRWFVDSASAIVESVETNNNVFKSITVVVKADLFVDNTTAPYTGTTQVGTSFTVRGRVRNLNTASFTTNFYVYYYYCPTAGPSGCAQLGSSYVNTNFTGGSSTTVTSPTLTLPLSAQSGRRYIRYFVDSTNVVSESNENNNNTYAPITVAVKPDLLVDNPVAPATGSTAQVGSTFTVTGRVRNLTTASFTTDFVVRYYYCPSNNTTGCVSLGQTTVTTNLAGNGTTTVTSPTLTMPSSATAGTRYIRYFVDSTAVISEVNEGNNNTYAPITVVRKPDLTVVNTQAPYSGSVSNTGDTFTVRAQVRNATVEAFSTNFYVYYYYCAGNSTNGCIQLGSSYVTNNFTGNDTVTVTSPTLSLPGTATAGVRYIRWFVDSTNVVSENNEANNNTWHAINVLNRPDLTVDNVVVPKSGSVSNQGDTFTVQSRVNNIAAYGFTTDFRLQYYYCPSNNTTGCVSLGTSTVTTNFTGAGSTTVVSGTLTLPSSIPAGTRYLRFFVDSGAAVAETNENNNNTYVAINVLNRPDLTVDATTAPYTGTTEVGQSFTVRSRVRNLSTIGFSTDFYINYYYCTAKAVASCTYLDRRLITTNFSGRNSYYYNSPTLKLPSSATAGTRYIRFFVDANTNITESNESNNDTYDAITVVVKPDLTADTLVAPLSGATAMGQTFTVRARVRNITSASMLTDFYVNYYYCTSASTSSCTYLNRSFVTQNFSGNYNYNVTSPSLTLPVTATAGTRYIRWFIDGTGVVAESDETNNNLYKSIVVKVNPDLTVTNAVAPSSGSTANVGDTFKVTSTINNKTTAGFTTNFYLYYYICKTASASNCTYLANTYVTTDMSGNSTLNVTSPTLTLPSAATSGTNYIRWFVDATTLITETNEGNNNTYKAITVVRKPDLTVDTSTVPLSGSASNAGSTFTVRARVRNLTSEAVTTDFALNYYYCPTKSPVGCTYLGRRTITTNFNGKASYYYNSTSLLVPNTATAGTRYIRFFVDAGAIISETNEGNNNHYHAITVLNVPDLLVNTTVAPATGQTANPGDKFTVTGRVVNNSTIVVTKDFTLTYYYCPSTSPVGCTLLAAQTITATVPASGFINVTSPTLTMPASVLAGTRYIRYFVDSGTVVSESNENNNNTYDPILVVNKPDLTIAMTKLPLSGSTQMAGDTFTTTYSVTNRNSAFVTNFYVTFYFCTAANTTSCTTLGQQYISTDFAVNQTSSFTSPTLVIPATAAPGTRYIRYFVDSSTVVGEANELNNNTFAPIVVLQSPDLSFASATVPKTGAVSDPGKTFTVEYTVTNRYAALTKNFAVSFYYCPSNNATGCVFLATQTVTDNFSSTQNRTYNSPTLTMPTAAAAGTRYIRLFVDSGAVVVESNETNNNLYKQITVLQRPDLFTDSVVVPYSGDTKNAGSTFTVRYRIRNGGSQAVSSSFNITYYYCPAKSTSGCVYLRANSVSSVAANGSLTFTSSTLTLPSTVQAGTRYLRIFVDSGSAVTEGDETNNNTYAAITVLAQPDLFFSSTVAPFSGSTAKPGDGFTVRYSIRNNNSAVTKTLYVTMYYCPTAAVAGCVQLQQSAVTGGFTVGQVRTFVSPSLTMPPGAAAGTRYIRFFVDSTGQVVESNEANNNTYDPITVVTGGKPDLALKTYTVNTSTPAGYGYNSSVVLTFDPENRGYANSSGFYVSFYYGDSTSTSGLVFLGRYYVSSLNARTALGNRNITVTMPAQTKSGDRYIHYFVDSYGAISEGDETNNRGYRKVVVAGKPDLRVASFKSTPTTALAGNSISLSYQLHNQGNAMAGAFVTKFYYSEDAVLNTATDVELKSLSQTSLNAKTYQPTAVGSFVATIPTIANQGTRYLFAFVDAGKTVGESNEANNVLMITITVTTCPNYSTPTLYASCPKTRPYCHKTKCVTCVYDSHCPKGKVCTSTGTCAECPYTNGTAYSGCPKTAPYCVKYKCSACAQNYHCKTGEYCSAGTCVTSCGDGKCELSRGENCSTCAKDCGCTSGNVCKSGVCRPPSWCPHTKPTPDKTNCGGKLCDNNKCTNQDCTQDSHCKAGYVCSSGKCTNACGDGSCQASVGENCSTCAADCACDPTKNKCVAGVCKPLDFCTQYGPVVDKTNCGGKICYKFKCTNWDCTNNTHCAAGAVCIANKCVKKECSNPGKAGVYSAECYRKYPNKVYCAQFACVPCPDLNYSGTTNAACIKQGNKKDYCVGYQCQTCPHNAFTSFPACQSLKSPAHKFCAGFQCAQCPYKSRTIDNVNCKGRPCENYQCLECSNNSATPKLDSTCQSASPGKPYCRLNKCIECPQTDPTKPSSTCVNKNPYTPFCYNFRCTACHSTAFGPSAACAAANKTTPYCLNGNCVQCEHASFKFSNICKTRDAKNPYCYQFRCVQCANPSATGKLSSECTALDPNKKYCVSHKCQECSSQATVSSSDCPSTKPICTNYKCVECTGNKDCPYGKECKANKCVWTNQTCTTCTSDVWCQQNMTAGKACGAKRKRCRPSDNVCVECMVDSDCSAGQKCSSLNTCVASLCPRKCNTDSDCRKTDCGTRSRCINQQCTDINQVNRCQPPNILIVLDKSGSMGSAGSALVDSKVTCTGKSQCTDFEKHGSKVQCRFSSAVGANTCWYTRWDTAVKAIKKLVTDFGGSSTVSYADRRIRFGLATFNSSGTINAPIYKDPPVIKSTLDGISPGGGTNYMDAFDKAKAHLQTALASDPVQRRTSAIVFVTDGAPNEGCSNSQSPAKVDQIYKLKNSLGEEYKIKTYVIGFGSGINQTAKDCLNKIVKQGRTENLRCSGISGVCSDKFFSADSQSELDTAFKAISNDATSEKCDGLDNDCDGQIDDGNPGGNCICMKSYTKPDTTARVNTKSYDFGTKNVRLYTFMASFSNAGYCEQPKKLGDTPLHTKYMQTCFNDPGRATSCNDNTRPVADARAHYCGRCCGTTTALTCSWPSSEECHTKFGKSSASACYSACVSWCDANKIKALNCLIPAGQLIRVGTGYNTAATASSSPTVLTRFDLGAALSRQPKRWIFVNLPGQDVRTLATRPLIATIVPNRYDIPTSATGSVPVGKYQWSTTNTNITPALLGIDTAKCGNATQCTKDKNDVIHFIRGYNDSGVSYRTYRLGAVKNSSPTVVGPPTAKLRDNTYIQWLNANNAAVTKRPSVVYVGSNDGQMHAFLANAQPNGQLFELWSYIPKTVVGKLRDVINGQDNKGREVVTVDGTPVVRNIQTYRYTDSKGNVFSKWRTVMVFGLRAGGRGYVAMDVTDPYKPRLLWEINHNSYKVPTFPGLGKFSKLGYTFGKPMLTTMLINWKGTLMERAVAVLPGGAALKFNNTAPIMQLDTSSTIGGVVYMVDLETGEFIREVLPLDATVGITAGKERSVAATPVGFGVAPSLTSRIFIADVLGRIFRVDTQDSNPCAAGEPQQICYGSQGDGWRTRLFYNLFTSSEKPQPVMTSPTIAFNQRGELVLVGGTGDLVEKEIMIGFNKVFSIREVINGRDSSGRIDPAQVSGIHNYLSTFNKLQTFDTNGQPVTQVVSTTATGEKMTGPPIIYQGAAYFTTYLPATTAPICGVRGSARLYGLHFDLTCRTADCYFDLFNNGKIKTALTPIRCCEQGGGATGSCNSSDTTKITDATFSTNRNACADLDYTRPMLVDSSVAPQQHYRYMWLGPNTLSMGLTITYQPGDGTITQNDPKNPQLGHKVGVGRPGKTVIAVQVAGRNPTTDNKRKLNQLSVIKPTTDRKLQEGNFANIGGNGAGIPVVISSWGAVLD
jgi:subtilase family serine protease